MKNEMTGVSYIQHLVYGDMVKDAAMAVELAAVLIRRNCGEAVLKNQQPLVAREDGDYWLVEGPPNKPEAVSDVGPVHVKLKKTDASVASLYFTLRTPPKAPDSVAKR